MRALVLTLAVTLAPLAGHAGVEQAVDDHILPAVAAFQAGTAALRSAAETDCTQEAVRPAYQSAFDAWMGLAHLQFGPLEEAGRGLSIAFWPDARGMVPKAVAGLVAEADPVVAEADAFAQVSVAGRGLFALEAVLYNESYDADDYACRLAVALSRDLARTGQALAVAWDGYAEILQTAGEPGNAAYMSEAEATRELYTALMTGLEFTKDQRLGRPMGTFERPRPTRAEAWRSGRSQRNVVLSLEALRGLAAELADAPATDAAFVRAIATAEALDDPVFAGVADPATRFRLEALQQEIASIQTAAATEIGAALGVSQGFNSQDGD